MCEEQLEMKKRMSVQKIASFHTGSMGAAQYSRIEDGAAPKIEAPKPMAKRKKSFVIKNGRVELGDASKTVASFEIPKPAANFHSVVTAIVAKEDKDESDGSVGSDGSDSDDDEVIASIPNDSDDLESLSIPAVSTNSKVEKDKAVGFDGPPMTNGNGEDTKEIETLEEEMTQLCARLNKVTQRLSHIKTLKKAKLLRDHAS